MSSEGGGSSQEDTGGKWHGRGWSGKILGFPHGGGGRLLEDQGGGNLRQEAWSVPILTPGFPRRSNPYSRRWRPWTSTRTITGTDVEIWRRITVAISLKFLSTPSSCPVFFGRSKFFFSPLPSFLQPFQPFQPSSDSSRTSTELGFLAPRERGHVEIQHQQKPTRQHVWNTVERRVSRRSFFIG